MKNEWDDYANDWDSNPDVQLYAEKAYQSLIEIIPVENKSILDFGCGTGALTERINGNAELVLAIDPSSEMVKQLEKKSLSNVVTIADYLTGELADKLINSKQVTTSKQSVTIPEKFDVIIASSVCSFLPDYANTLTLLKSLLVENGTFIQWDWLAESDTDTMGLSIETVEQALKKSAFAEVNITTPFTMKSPKGNTPVLMAIAKNTNTGF